MSLSNYALGAKIDARTAQTGARPELSQAQAHALRRVKIVATAGALSTIQLLDDTGQVINDANGDPVQITRVAQFPPESDDTARYAVFDAYGVPTILNAAGGSASAGLWDFGILID